MTDKNDHTRGRERRLHTQARERSELQHSTLTRALQDFSSMTPTRVATAEPSHHARPPRQRRGGRPRRRKFRTRVNRFPDLLHVVGALGHLVQSGRQADSRGQSDSRRRYPSPIRPPAEIAQVTYIQKSSAFLAMRSPSMCSPRDAALTNNTPPAEWRPKRPKGGRRRH